jgi:hypothetical protein
MAPDPDIEMGKCWRTHRHTHTHTPHTHSPTHTHTHTHTLTLTLTHTHSNTKKVSKNYVTTFGLPNIHFFALAYYDSHKHDENRAFFNSQVAPLKRYTILIHHFYTKHL